MVFKNPLYRVIRLRLVEDSPVSGLGTARDDNTQLPFSHWNPLKKIQSRVGIFVISSATQFCTLQHKDNDGRDETGEMQNVLHWSLVAAVFSCYISHVDRRFVSLWWCRREGEGVNLRQVLRGAFICCKRWHIFPHQESLADEKTWAIIYPIFNVTFHI